MGIATSIDFGFNTKYFSYSKILQFCIKILKMKQPTVSNYVSHRNQVCLSLIDPRQDDFSFLVQFNQKSNKKNTTFDVRVILSDHKSKLTTEEQIDLEKYKYLLLHCYGFPVYMYFMTTNFNIAVKRIGFGARGVEGVVYNDDNNLVSDTPSDARTILNTVDSNGYSPEIARVWFYERDDDRAIQLLQNSIRIKEYHKKLKKQYKLSNRQNKRRETRIDSSYLRKCFEYFSNDPKTASRLTNALARHFDIYNLTDLRQRRVSVEELSRTRNIGAKSIETYQMALLWINSLPNTD